MCHHIEFKEQGEKTTIMNGQKRNKTLGAMKFVEKKIITMLKKLQP